MDAIFIKESSNNAKIEVNDENVRKPFYDIFKRPLYTIIIVIK